MLLPAKQTTSTKLLPLIDSMPKMKAYQNVCKQSLKKPRLLDKLEREGAHAEHQPKSQQVDVKFFPIAAHHTNSQINIATLQNLQVCPSKLTIQEKSISPTLPKALKIPGPLLSPKTPAPARRPQQNRR